MKRFLALLLLGILVGCTQSAPAPQNETPATDTVADTETEKESTRLISLNLPGMT